MLMKALFKLDLNYQIINLLSCFLFFFNKPTHLLENIFSGAL